MTSLGFASIPETAAKLRARTLTSTELTQACLSQIAARDSQLRAFTQVFEADALQQAAASDARFAQGAPLGPLDGIPIAIKDNIATIAGHTTCASNMLRDYRSPFDATAVVKLLEGGAVIVGKTNLDEFAMGGSGEHSCFGPTAHPLDAQRVPGGSSSGSAAAVAAGMALGALGSDTGGSIRQPAGWCGIAGCKPTYGRVSRYGLVAYASSLDQIGTLASTAAGARMILAQILGHDGRDATSAAGAPGLDEVRAAIAGPITIGVPQGLLSGCGASVLAAMESAKGALAASGARLVDIELPHADAAIAAYYIIATAEASSNLARFDGVRYGHRAKSVPGQTLTAMVCASRSEGFGPEVQRRIMLGTHVLSSGYYDAYYLTALKARRLIAGDYAAAFGAGCHAILMPTSPGPAFIRGSKADPLTMYLEDVYTVGVNLAGLPAVAIGAWRDEQCSPPLPIGLQLIGPFDSEGMLFDLASVLERSAKS